MSMLGCREVVWYHQSLPFFVFGPKYFKPVWETPHSALVDELSNGVIVDSDNVAFSTRCGGDPDKGAEATARVEEEKAEEVACSLRHSGGINEGSVLLGSEYRRAHHARDVWQVCQRSGESGDSKEPACRHVDVGDGHHRVCLE
jgi:hypothetical protein